MKKNILSFYVTVLCFILSIFITTNANADGTYAVVDSNGNVTNVIVCGSFCSGGTVGPGGDKAVLQVAPDPSTGENRGGFWSGPGTTTYDEQTETFTVVQQTETVKSVVDIEDNSEVVSSVKIIGENIISFKYKDTIGSNLFTRNGFVIQNNPNKNAIVSVTKNDITESLSLGSSKTAIETSEIILNSNLSLLSSKVETLIGLLDSWIK